MSHHTTTDTEPVYTSTRVPPAEPVERASRPDADPEAAPDDEPIAVTRIPSTVTRFG